MKWVGPLITTPTPKERDCLSRAMHVTRQDPARWARRPLHVAPKRRHQKHTCIGIYLSVPRSYCARRGGLRDAAVALAGMIVAFAVLVFFDRVPWGEREGR